MVGGWWSKQKHPKDVCLYIHIIMDSYLNMQYTLSNVGITVYRTLLLFSRSVSQSYSGGFRTMRDLIAGGQDDSEQEEEDQPQEFYAGGAEHSSGTVITGPSKRNPNPRDMAQAVFNAGKR